MHSPIFVFSGAPILFATGIDGLDFQSTLQSTQVYTSSGETCSGIAPFPSSIGYATGGNVDKTPVLCGGSTTLHPG